MSKMLVVGCVGLAVMAGLLLSGCGSDEGQAKAQTLCPVMGNKIDKNYYIDYQGKRIYFCCEACPKAFRADPQKYMKKLTEQGVVLADAPEDDPGGGD